MGLPYLITKGEFGAIDDIRKGIIFYGICFVNFVIAPFYYISRIANIMFPFMILIMLYVNGIDIFGGDIDMFQTVTLLLYLSFISILIVLSIPVMNEQYLLWHIMPTKELNTTSITLEEVKLRYDDI